MYIHTILYIVYIIYNYIKYIYLFFSSFDIYTAVFKTHCTSFSIVSEINTVHKLDVYVYNICNQNFYDNYLFSL